MKYTEKIIKYLSGDLNTAEEKEFKQGLENEKELFFEFEIISDIWRAMEETLKITSHSEERTKDEIIAEIEAAIDAEFYKRESLSSKEKRLKEKLDVIIQEKERKSADRRKDYRSLSLLSAAIIATLFIIFYPEPDPLRLVKKYYKPSQDTMLSEQVQSTPRGNFARGYHYFAEEEFPDAKAAFEYENETLAYNDLAKLFYALSCFETGSKDTAFVLLDSLSLSHLPEIREASYWYYGILLIFDDETEDGISKLAKLSKASLHYREAQKIIASFTRNTDR